MGRRTKMARAAAAVEDNVAAAMDSTASAVDLALGRGRAAQRAARQAAQQKAKKTGKKAQKQAQKQVRNARKMGDEIRADAEYRADALRAAAKGKPRKGRLRRVLGVLALGGAVAVAVRSRSAAPGSGTGSGGGVQGS